MEQTTPAVLGPVERMVRPGAGAVPACPFAVFDEFGVGACDRVLDYAAALVAAERDRMRVLFRAALSDKGVTWPGEVDILYDRMFAEPWAPNGGA
mgnify:CR=1 FL=1